MIKVALDGTKTEDEFNELVKEFETATDQMRERFNDRRSVAADVENVLGSCRADRPLHAA
ncbi:MAG: hypothetical protein WKF84_08750 [Pyrinomonadaceae bacterium]